MGIMIEYGAVRTVLYGTISCQCPVTPETDQALFTALGQVPPRERREDHPLPLEPFLEAATQNPVKTPLQLCAEFASFSRDDPREFTLTRGDALRYFSCRYHFDRMLQGLRPLEVHHLPSFLTSHMILPVTPADETTVLYQPARGDRSITFTPVFAPPSIGLSPGKLYGLHFGMILTELSPDQAELVELHLARIPELQSLMREVSRVDFSAFPGSENHFLRVRQRWDLVGHLVAP
ncbi:hypothetical protein AU468_02955 [Alkalispirochaeta sphaeroplastigenens]|uniref:Uncharacterized protein n=1 Tax=Alkalispirochaeta sphaeroplastigenens TaxID=1187066 RepID=A0A2S4JYT4_9SPIO|nr:hypothetical protein [Alkalispirochaeta sphaeroplastigenens]POR04687.1 hypothetical protein AU468_02955 [Alkalispirochaeta sphaeroplastigenens]